MLLNVSICRLRLGRPLAPYETPKLRGFFGREFAEEVLLHHHSPDGSLVYTYPLVQFKVIGRTAYLVGIAEGSDLLQRLWLRVDKARLGNEDLPVLEAHLTTHRAKFGETNAPSTYRFLTPWLALNQQNDRHYRSLRTAEQRELLLERILIGNCLSLAKGLKYTVHARLVAHCSGLREVRCALKGVPMLGFLGEFQINFEIPELLGLGKSVSRGFGTVRKAG